MTRAFPASPPPPTHHKRPQHQFQKMKKPSAARKNHHHFQQHAGIETQEGPSSQGREKLTAKKNSSTSKGKHGAKSKAKMPPSSFQKLPQEMVLLLFPFLTWKDTAAMLLVDASLSRIVLETKKAYSEWKNTVCIADNADASVELLRQRNRGCLLNARFAPNLIMINVGSGDSIPFKTGGYWKHLAQMLESEKLIPRECPVMMLYTPLGVMGTGSEETPNNVREYEEELGDDGDEPNKTVTLSITVAHLPGTSVETAVFDRKWLRQQARGRGDEPEYPFTTIENAGGAMEDTNSGLSNDQNFPSFLLFSVNANSSEELAPIVSKWHPGASIVGGIFPFADRCIPMAVYKSGLVSSAAKDVPRQHKLSRKAKQSASSSSSSAAGQLDFPTNLLIRFRGQVGIRDFSSCGFQPITPVVQCETISSAYLLDQFAHYRAYETVLWRNPNTGEEMQYRMVDLLRQYGSFARENSLNIYSSDKLKPMLSILQSAKEYNEEEMITAAPLAERINRLDMLICTQGGDIMSMDKHWEKGDYGFVAVQLADCGRFAHTVALKSLKTRMERRKENPLGAFVISCALKGIELYGEKDAEAKIYDQIFPGLPLNGFFSGGEIGPVAVPMGLPACITANAPRLQSNTTCGAVFYLKPSTSA
uniref:Uncharacterized protein n=1 Tax=Globisporangium ultimum (strain ATCC 200006 / CBS 805.95 / DAOM BR144) TaxID=431595 RepID=K3WC92_GLOUD